MNIKDLKNLIENLPDDMEVVMAKDAEGNNFSPLSDGESDAVYIPDSTYSGDVYYHDVEEWEGNSYTNDELKKMKKSLVLYPVN